MSNGNQIRSYLDYLYKLDYKERPVDIETFLCDDAFLGKTTRGGKTVYNVWKRELAAFLGEDTKLEIILTGAIGTGKTRGAIMGAAWLMHRLLCLKSPWDYFRLSGGGKMALAFFNLTKTLGRSRGFQLLQSYLMDSSWFRERSTGVRGDKDKFLEFSEFEYVLASPMARGFGTIGEDVIIAILDELDSSEVSIKMKERVIKAYQGTVSRFRSRFVYDDESLGKCFLVASKQEEMSFLNTVVEEMKNSDSVHVVDIPLWEAKPSSNYSGDKFPILVGDAYTEPKILSDEAAKEEFRLGKRIVYVPVEYRKSFKQNIVLALRDVAGISVNWVRRSKLFGAESFITDCIDKTKEDPVDKVTILTGLKDPAPLIKHFDLSKVRVPKIVQRFIHEDIAYSGDGDAVGLAMSCVKGWKTTDVQIEEGLFRKKRVPVIETDFAIRIKAKPGDQVPAHKVRKLVLDIRSEGFNIAKFTADLKLLSNDTQQILNEAGIESEYFSVDRDVSAYLDFRNLVLEQRWICHYQPYLIFELKHLEADLEAGKIDHPQRVKDVVLLESGDVKEVVLKGSKDISDAVVGSIGQALKLGKAPIDVEDMEKIMNKVSRPTVSGVEDKYWWADLASGVENKKEEEKVQEAEDVDEFVNILRAVNKNDKEKKFRPFTI